MSEKSEKRKKDKDKAGFESFFSRFNKQWVKAWQEEAEKRGQSLNTWARDALNERANKKGQKR